MGRKIIAILMAGVISQSAVCGSLKDEMPFGVFWAWERNGYNAECAGLTLNEYAEKLLKLLKENHCDAVWFVHGPGRDHAEWFMPLMGKYGIKGMVESNLVRLYYDGQARQGLGYVAKVAKNTFETYGRYDSLMGYVLKDEPQSCSVQHSDCFYEVMKQVDPKRDTALIAMPQQCQLYLEDTQMPVICTDIYHFGGEGSKYIPSPVANSQRTYRETVRNAVKVADARAKNVWIMPMAFGNTWGPHYWDDEGRHWAMPGAYFHWRMPTPAESSWQVWEAVRGGAKGVLFYILNDTIHRTKAQLEPDAQYPCKNYEESQLARVVRTYGCSPLNVGRCEIDRAEALTYLGGDPTPQFVSIGRAFRALGPFKKRLLKSRRAKFPVFFPESSRVKAQTFEVPGESERLAILVNDDVENENAAVIRLPENVVRVRDLSTGRDIPVVKIEGACFKKVNVTIAPGDGAVLAAAFADGYAGLPLLREDFGLFAVL